ARTVRKTSGSGEGSFFATIGGESGINDVVQQALIKAAEKYDPERLSAKNGKPIKFQSLATTYTRSGVAQLYKKVTGVTSPTQDEYLRGENESREDYEDRVRQLLRTPDKRTVNLEKAHTIGSRPYDPTNEAAAKERLETIANTAGGLQTLAVK